MSSSAPRISVLLPVYNGGPYLASAIESVLAQSFPDFELLILNDGSKDDSAAIAQSYSDRRIRYFEHSNIGLPATLNKGAGYARGEFLFRQDQDDLSYPDRFAHQVAYLDTHPDVALLGTWSRIFVDGNSAAAYRYHRHPTTHAPLALSIIFDSPFVHSSVAMRRSALETLGGYSCDPMRQPPEDFELWSRMCRHYQAANLPEVLVDYREVSDSMSRALRHDFTDRMLRISTENLHHFLANSPYTAFSDKLARIYRLDGRQPTEDVDGHMIEGALVQVGQALSAYGDIYTREYRQQLSRIRHQLMRNYWLGRCHNMAARLAVKAGFRALRVLHG